jgi:hypothetical protein
MSRPISISPNYPVSPHNSRTTVALESCLERVGEAVDFKLKLNSMLATTNNKLGKSRRSDENEEFKIIGRKICRPTTDALHNEQKHSSRLSKPQLVNTSDIFHPSIPTTCSRQLFYEHFLNVS